MKKDEDKPVTVADFNEWFNAAENVSLRTV
jgi:hypothetical protein